MEAARAHPDRFAILGNFPLDKPESRALVDGWKQRPGMLGCRFTFIGPEQSQWPTDGTVDWLWPAAERAGLPIAMMAANFLPKVAEVAQRHPTLKLILDRLGRPRGDTSPSERWANPADARSRNIPTSEHRRDKGPVDGTSVLGTTPIPLLSPSCPPGSERHGDARSNVLLGAAM
jgi:hypothetical protein